MNKKKIAALVLSGTMLMGAAGFGAYSWFKSSATVDANLIVKTGTLAVTATPKKANPNLVNYNGWQVENSLDTLPEDTKSESKVAQNPKENDPQILNLRPGDILTKIVTIKNTGSLKERVNYIINNQIKESYGDAVKFAILKGDKLANNMVLYPESEANKDKPNEVEVKLVLTLDPNGMTGETVNGNKVTQDGKTNYQDTKLNLKEMLNNKANIIEIKGEQVNENPVQK